MKKLISLSQEIENKFSENSNKIEKNTKNIKFLFNLQSETSVVQKKQAINYILDKLDEFEKNNYQNTAYIHD